MKYTNKLGLPQPIVDAITNDPYDSGGSDISLTQLIAPVQQQELMRLFKDDLVEDIADNLYALLGQLMHGLFERAGEGGVRIIERRFRQTILGWDFSGQVDLIEDRILDDYKLMSVWEIIYGLKEDKIAQLNALRWLAIRNGVPVDRIRVVGILRDWQKSKAKRDHQYPQTQGAVVDVPIWDLDKTQDYITERISMHQEARANNEWPGCTDDERWYSGDKFAVMKKGRKSALAVAGLDTREKAEAWMTANISKGPTHIDFRPGENRRCADYCAVGGDTNFCPQWVAIRDEL